MKVGVLGSGTVGQTIGTKLVGLGHEVYMGSREAANPKAIAWANKENVKKNDGTNKRALFGTFANAAEFAEIIFNCTLGSASLDALQQAGAVNLSGKILMDVSNPLEYGNEGWSLTVCNTDSLGEQIQRAFPQTKVVKTLNTVNCSVMVDPNRLIQTTDAFMSGNDITAKAMVMKILRDWFGWRSVIDLGDITTARGVEMYVLFWHNVRNVVHTPGFNIKVIST